MPRWAVVSSAGAPVALIGGWTLAAALQSDFSSVHDTISALAAPSAEHRWVMTAGFVVVGCCHVATAAGLTPARAAGRGLLALGGLATLVVAASPIPASPDEPFPAVGSSAVHTAAASLAFGCLAVWPALAARRGSRVWALRPRWSFPVAAVLVAATGWFGARLDGDLVGLSERIAAGAQALWPLAVVLSARASAHAAEPLGRRPKTSAHDSD
ncbi:DUF998 domain-containing protein [Jatrophihabitans sp. GAS493]|uniref:DUF998 domain-containing protein n=1 Tax=Jatrophihabitans sp. GAS493 TaxID=1907575 RepID=UPI0012FDBD0E|nr:DUF998 domain-containing protein [Jatrophihabitans sp. GAS493]